MMRVLQLTLDRTSQPTEDIAGYIQHSTIEQSKVSQRVLPVEDGKVNKSAGRILSVIAVDELPPLENVEEKDEPRDETGVESYLETHISGKTSTDGSTGMKRKLQNDLCEEGLVEEAPNKTKRVPWTQSEVKALQKEFSGFLKGSRASIHHSKMKDVQEKCPHLKKRSLAQIKTQLYNLRMKK